MSFCKCGCGQKTYIPPATRKDKGWTKGVPVDFVKGHNMKTKPEYLVEDRGFTTPCWIWNRAIYGEQSEFISRNFSDHTKSARNGIESGSRLYR